MHYAVLWVESSSTRNIAPHTYDTKLHIWKARLSLWGNNEDTNGLCTGQKLSEFVYAGHRFQIRRLHRSVQSRPARCCKVGCQVAIVACKPHVNDDIGRKLGCLRSLGEANEWMGLCDVRRRTCFMSLSLAYVLADGLRPPLDHPLVLIDDFWPACLSMTFRLLSSGYLHDDRYDDSPSTPARLGTECCTFITRLYTLFLTTDARLCPGRE